MKITPREHDKKGGGVKHVARVLHLIRGQGRFHLTSKILRNTLCTSAKKFDIKSIQGSSIKLLTTLKKITLDDSFSIYLTVKNTSTNTRPHIHWHFPLILSPMPGSPDASFLSVITDYVKNSLVTVKNQAELWALKNVCAPTLTLIR